MVHTDYLNNDRDNDMVTYEVRGHGMFRAKSYVVDQVMADEWHDSLSFMRDRYADYAGVDVKEYDDVHSRFAFIIMMADGRQGTVNNEADMLKRTFSLPFTPCFYDAEDGSTDLRNSNGELLGWVKESEHGSCRWTAFTAGKDRAEFAGCAESKDGAMHGLLKRFAQ